MALKKSEIISLIIAAIIIIFASALLYLNSAGKINYFDSKAFYFVLGIALIIGGLPFFINLIIEGRKEDNLNQMFLEFARDLVEGVKSGTPISKSIINVRTKDYGSLNPHINKLANQIALGIPVKFALEVFAKDIKSHVISRAVSLIREAETSGGRIESILESVTFSVSQIEKLKKERKAAIYNLTVQGYIIFFIFLAIMLVMRFKILTILPGLNEGISGEENADMSEIFGGGGIGAGANMNPDAFSTPFLALLIAQGFFVGLVIGKISEGSIKYGLKHSFILVALAWIISTGAELILG